MSKTKKATGKRPTARTNPGAAQKRRTKPVAPDPRVVKALAHPLRMRILARLNEQVLSPVELAREFDVSLPLVSYHVKTLRDLDCLELVSERQVRGAIEHYYRGTRRAYLSEKEWARLSLDRRQAVTGAVLRDLISDALDSLQTGDMDRRDNRHVTFTTLNLDERAWTEMNELLDDVLDSALRLQAESAGRVAKGTSDGEVRSRLGILHYEPVPERPSTGVEPARRPSKSRAKRPR
jgi:DNA-binding transcriptional ArsR family regulator